MKKIFLNADARKLIKQGIDKCCDVVKVSLGKNGSNVLIYNGAISEIINDGVSIAKEVEVKNEIEQAGIQLAKQCASQTDTDAGDGTTTTLVLLQSILNEIITEFQTENPRELRDSLFEEAKDLLSKIKTKKIKTKKDLYNLALTSSLDEQIAQCLSEIYSKLGKDAKISVEEVGGDRFEYKIVKGLQFESKPAETKLLSAYDKTILEKVDVLVKEKVETNNDIQEKLSEVVKNSRNSLVVISNEFSRNVLISMMKTADFKIIPIEYSQLRTLEDIKDFIGDSLVDKIIIEEDKTTLIGGNGQIEKKIKYLKEKKKEEQSEYEKEELDRRIGNLSGSVAQIKIGKATDVERIETVLKIEDALGAIRGAYELGYVKGGGEAIFEASKSCNNTRAGNILKKVCKVPNELITANGEVPEDVIDSFKTVKHSLLNALSTATSILTVEAALIEEKDED